MENKTVPADILTDQPQEVKADLRRFNKAEDQVDKALAALSAITEINDQQAVDNAMEVMKKAKKVENIIESKRKELGEPFREAVNKINDFAKKLTGKIPPAIQVVKDKLLAYQKAEQDKAKKIRTDARIEQLLSLGFTHYPDGKEDVKGNVYANEDSYFSVSAVENKTDGEWEILVQGIVNSIEAKRQAKLQALNKEKDDADFFGAEEAEAVEKQIEQLQSQPAAQVTRHVPAFGASKVKGLTKRWVFEVTNAAQVPSRYLMVDETKIRTAVATGVRDIPGVRIYQDESISLR